PAEVEKPKRPDIHKGLFVVTLDEKTLRARGGDALASVEPRPAARAADRSAVKRVKPEAPSNWKGPAPAAVAAPAVHPQAKLTTWPHAWSASSAVHVRVEFLAKPTVRQALVRETTDLKTGKASRSPLWPWAHRDRGKNMEKATLVAALSPRG